MILLNLRTKLSFVILIAWGFFLGLNQLVIAKENFNSNNINEWISSSEADNLPSKSRLEQSLEMINKMDNSQLKVMLLNDLVLAYAKLGDNDKAIAILEKSLSIARSFEDLTLQVTTITEIANTYAEIGEQEQALEIFHEAVEIVNLVEDQFLQGQLLLQIAFKYEKNGQEELAQSLFTKSQNIIAASYQPQPEFPFQETSSQLKLGFSGNVRSFRDTNAFVGVNVDFNKQWSVNDFFVDATAFIDYDSSRSVNNFRPSGLIQTVYRSHFNPNWSFFTNSFHTVNQDSYAARNNDEDLSILSYIYLGAGLNLWRGDSPSEFLDFQLGLGARYEYDYIEFEQRRNQVEPVLAITLLGRDIAIGQAKLNQTFALIPSISNGNNLIISSDSRLSLPLTQRWSFSNRLFVRYRNEFIYEDNPKLEFFFSTGLEYSF